VSRRLIAEDTDKGGAGVTQAPIGSDNDGQVKAVFDERRKRITCGFQGGTRMRDVAHLGIGVDVVPDRLRAPSGPATTPPPVSRRRVIAVRLLAREG
jgi:hypothetical protein